MTWWSHSAQGYHPSILMRIENASGQNLPGAVIKFQGRFTNLNDGMINVAREEIRGLEAKKQLYVFLKGQRAVELPTDQNSWPHIECKVMARVKDGTNEGETQTLLTTKLDSLTMSFENAMTILAKQPDLRVGRSINAQESQGQPVTTLGEESQSSGQLLLGAATTPDSEKSDNTNSSLRTGQLRAADFGTVVLEGAKPPEKVDATKASATVDETYKRLTAMELRLLKTSYSTDILSSRIERLETKIFGRAQKGTMMARVQQLETKTTPSPVVAEDKLAKVEEQLGRMETAKFGKKFESEDIVKRLERLEIKQFGKVGSGKSTERLDALLLSE